MSVRGYRRVARAQWHLLLAGLLFGLAGAGAFTVLTPSSYASEMTLFLTTQRASSDAALAYEGALLAREKAPSYVELVTSELTLGGVGAALAPERDPSDLAQHITATLVPNTALIDVRVTDASPEGAQRIADVLAGRIAVLVEDLEEPEGFGPAALNARIVEPPTYSPDPVSPQPLLNLALGALLGLLAGMGAAMTWDALRRSVRSAADAAEATGAPVLGLVAEDRHAAASPLTVVDQPHGARAEAFRRIRARLAPRQPSRPGVVLAIVSAHPGDGRTSTACDLAAALARSGRRVALVDADLRDPGVGALLGAGPGPGLRDLLRQPAQQQVHLFRPEPGVDVLGAGGSPADPAEGLDALASDRMAEILSTLAASHDVVLVDTPPARTAGDGLAIAPLCDGVLLVARYGRTRLADLRATAAAIDSVSAAITGVVVTRVPRRLSEGRWEAWPVDTGGRVSSGHAAPVPRGIDAASGVNGHRTPRPEAIRSERD